MTEPTKITFILPIPFDHPIGGYAVAYEYANRLAQRGYAVTIVHPWFERPGQPRRWLGYLRRQMQVRLRRGRGRVINWFPINPAVTVRLIPFLSPRFLPRADLTIFTAWQTLRASGGHQGQRFQIVYDYEFWRAGNDALRDEMRSAFCAPHVHRIATSRAVNTMLGEAGSDAVGTVTCGIDLERWRPPNPPGPRPSRVAFPLRDEPHKGADIALAAAAQIKAQLPAVELVCFGPGRQSVPSFIDHRGVVTIDELRDIYAGAAVFLLPSLYEGWGLPAAEAMACGAAVVTTANGGAEDFCIENQTALVVPVADSDALAEAALSLLRDDQTRARLAARGIEQAQKMSWDAAATELERLLAGANETRPGAPAPSRPRRQIARLGRSRGTESRP